MVVVVDRSRAIVILSSSWVAARELGTGPPAASEDRLPSAGQGVQKSSAVSKSSDLASSVFGSPTVLNRSKMDERGPMSNASSSLRRLVMIKERSQSTPMVTKEISSLSWLPSIPLSSEIILMSLRNLSFTPSHVVRREFWAGFSLIGESSVLVAFIWGR